MRCDIYNSLSQKGVRLYIREGAKPQDLVPQVEYEKIGPLESREELKSVPFSIGEPLMGVSVENIISNVERHGYYIHKFEVKVEARVSEAGAALGAGLLLASLGGGPIGAIIGATVGFLLANSSKEKNSNDS